MFSQRPLDTIQTRFFYKQLHFSDKPRVAEHCYQYCSKSNGEQIGVKTLFKSEFFIWWKKLLKIPFRSLVFVKQLPKFQPQVGKMKLLIKKNVYPLMFPGNLILAYFRDTYDILSSLSSVSNMSAWWNHIIRLISVSL